MWRRFPRCSKGATAEILGIRATLGKEGREGCWRSISPWSAGLPRTPSPARRVTQHAQRVWTGKRKPPPENAKGLQARMSATRGGRTILRTAKTATLAGKVALGSTIGAPVMIPRATRAAKAATRVRSATLKAKLATAKAKRSNAAKKFGKEWAANTGLTATVRAARKGPLPKAVIAASVHLEARDRVQRRAALRLSGTKRKARVVPGASDRIADHEPLGERAAVVGAHGTDGEHFVTDARQENRFAVRMPQEDAPHRKVTRRNAGR